MVNLSLASNVDSLNSGSSFRSDSRVFTQLVSVVELAAETFLCFTSDPVTLLFITAAETTANLFMEAGGELLIESLLDQTYYASNDSLFVFSFASGDITYIAFQ